MAGPPLPLGQPPVLQTVATQWFRNLDYNSVVNLQFDTNGAFIRALKVFRLTYAQFENIIPELYQQKLDEYVDAICGIYELVLPQPQNLNQYIGAVDQLIASEELEIKIGVIRFRGRDQVRQPMVQIDSGIENSKITQSLDIDNELQAQNVHPFLPFVHNFDVNVLRQLRQQNRVIRIALNGKDWVQSERQLNEFQISYREIPAEGFYDWFDFGRGVGLLIKIEIRVSREHSSVDPTYPSKFHLHTILPMIWKKLLDYRQNRRVETTHKSYANKSKVSYIRQRVDPNSDQAFWSTPYSVSNVMESIKKLSLEQKPTQTLKERQTVRYTDLQIGFHFNSDEFDSSVCLCSELCNWNAFFYFNPIYRFLFVRHNQLYMQNRTNVPNLYMFAIGTQMYIESQNQIVAKTPLLQLLSSANECRIEYWNELLKDQNQMNAYNASSPDTKIMNALTYNSMRYTIKLVDFNLQSDINPFSDICIENMINYYKVLSDLHQSCSQDINYIPSDELQNWAKEMDRIGRYHYKHYVRRSYLIQLDVNSPVSKQTVDYLFGEDYEYSSFLVKTNSERDIKRMRDRVRNAFPSNPFNFRVMCNPFGISLIYVHKFIRKVDPMLPSAQSSNSRYDVLGMCHQLDTDFETLFQNQNNFFFIFEPNSVSQDLLPLRVNLFIMYTLKVYSIGFGIQWYCIHSLIAYNQRLGSKQWLQVCTTYQFIWNNEWIEHTFRTTFANQYLFGINPAISQSFVGFYVTFWGLAAHETQRNITVMFAIQSALHQYNRMYCWQRNDGNNRRVFTRILDSLSDGFHDIINRSDIIYINFILTATQTLSQRFDGYLEALDVLVYYLVKANCFMIVCAVSDFMRCLQALQVDAYVQLRVHYSLCKPGWVPLFRTMRTAMAYLNRLKANYILFDDEFNRISNALEETKRLIKEIYRTFYQKLIHNWVSELVLLFNTDLQQPDGWKMVVFHLAMGTSLLAAFADDFREQINGIRKWLFSVWIGNYSVFEHNVWFNNCRAIVENYWRDRNECQRALPLLSAIWQNSYQEIWDEINKFEQISAQQLNINLVSADN